MKSFFEKIIGGIPYLILLIILGGMLNFLWKGGLTYNQFLDLLKILIWPSVVLIALLFFRKVFTYMFFSMEEFNFFGAKGSLEDVETMIRKKADALWKAERERGKIQKERKGYQKKIDDLKNSNLEIEDRAGKSVNLAQQLLDENEKFQQQNLNLTAQVDVLVNQISTLQGNRSQSPNTDNADIGSGAQIIDTSPTEPAHE